MFTAGKLILVLGLSMIIVGCPRREVTFEAATSKPAYAGAEPVEITLKLTNTGNTVVEVSDRLDGNIQVASLTRDGANVPTRTVTARYDEDLAFTLQQSLKPLQPGESVSISWRSVRDNALGGRALAGVQFQPDGRHQVTYYSINSPGTYRLSVFYRFPAPVGTRQDAFTEKTNQVDVTFTVNP